MNAAEYAKGNNWFCTVEKPQEMTKDSDSSWDQVCAVFKFYSCGTGLEAEMKMPEYCYGQHLRGST